MDFSPPIHFLALQCLECTLKSFLHARGVELRELKQTYRHDLVRTLDKAKELGLENFVTITPEIEDRLALIAPLYEGKDLQYFQNSGHWRLVRRNYPLPAELLDDVASIHDALDRAYRAQGRRGKGAADQGDSS
jgi:hypothetical protein